MASVDPAAFTNAFARQVQADDQRNALARQNQRDDEVMAMRRTQFGNEQQQFQQQQATQEAEGKRAALGRVGSVARQALSITDPTQRRGFLQQAIPAYQQDFAALGSDTSKLSEMLAMPEEQLTGLLTQASQFAPQDKPVQVAAGGSLVDPRTNKAIFTAPNPGQEETARHNRETERISLINANKPAGATIPSGYEVDPNTPGRLRPTPGGPQDPESGKGKITDNERLTAGYAQRMRESADRISALNYTPTTSDMVAYNYLLSGPGVKQAWANKVLSPEARQYIQSVQDFNRAKLRKESGAAIGKEEVFGDLSTFFPVPGDDATTVQQKAAARETAIQGMINASGAAYQGKGPKVGAIEDGYRFRGGDPADQKNWEPVK